MILGIKNHFLSYAPFLCILRISIRSPWRSLTDSDIYTVYLYLHGLYKCTIKIGSTISFYVKVIVTKLPSDLYLACSRSNKVAKVKTCAFPFVLVHLNYLSSTAFIAVVPITHHHITHAGTSTCNMFPAPATWLVASISAFTVPLPMRVTSVQHFMCICNWKFKLLTGCLVESSQQHMFMLKILMSSSLNFPSLPSWVILENSGFSAFTIWNPRNQDLSSRFLATETRYLGVKVGVKFCEKL